MPVALAEGLRPELKPAHSPQPGRLAKGEELDLLVVSKANITTKARTRTERGKLPGIYAVHQPGDKVTVESSEKVRTDLGDTIEVDDKILVAGNGPNLLQAITEDPRVRRRVRLDVALGRDDHGEKIRSTMHDAGVQVYPSHYDRGDTPSALDVEVRDDNGAEDRIIFSGSPKDMPQVTREKLPHTPPGFIYLTSIGGETWDTTYRDVTSYAKEKDVPYAVSPGSLQLKALTDTSERGIEKRQALYSAIAEAAILFVNAKEAKALFEGAPLEKYANMTDAPEWVSDEHKNQVELLLRMKHLGANMVSMTDGENGSYLLDENGVVLHLPVLRAKNIVDRTGAGDTYAAGLLKAYMEGLSLEESMRRGAIYAHAAIQVEGVPKGFMDNYPVDKMSLETLDTLVPKVVYSKQYDSPNIY